MSIYLYWWEQFIFELFLIFVIIYLILSGLYLKRFYLNKNLSLINFLFLSFIVSFICLSFIFYNQFNISFLIDIKESFIFNGLLFNNNSIKFLTIQYCLIFFTFLLALGSYNYLRNNKIFAFEFYILLYFLLLSSFIMVRSSDLLMLYLAIEFQSLILYIFAASKRYSIYSSEAGLKYFIQGAFVSVLLLLGFSLIYYSTGLTKYSDFWIFFQDLYIRIVWNGFKNNYLDVDFQNFKYFELFRMNDSQLNFNGLTHYDFAPLNHDIDSLILTSKIYNNLSWSYNMDDYSIKQKAHRFWWNHGSCFETSFFRSNMKEGWLYFYCPELWEDRDNLPKYNYPKIWKFLEVLDERLVQINFFNFLSCKTPSFNNSKLNFSFLFQTHENLALILGITFVIFAFFFKLSIFPFSVWLPDVYHGSPLVVTMVFTILPKLSIFFTFYNFVEIFIYELNFKFFDGSYIFNYLIIFFTLISILVGSIGALYQEKLKRILAFSTIANSGFLLIPVTLNSIFSFEVAFFYIIIYSFLNFSLFYFLIMINSQSSNFKIKTLKDLVLLKNDKYILAILLVFIIFSVAGIPPLLGFYNKTIIFIYSFYYANNIWNSFYLFLILFYLIFFGIISVFYYLRFIRKLYFNKTQYPKFFCNISLLDSFIIYLILFFNLSFWFVWFLSFF